MIYPPLYHFIMKVKGTRMDLEHFRGSIEGHCTDITAAECVGEYSAFCMNAIIPLPEEAFERRRIDVLCEYRLKYWGTENEIICSKANEKPHELTYFIANFGDEVPWLIFNKIFATYPHLKIEISYECERLGYTGHIIAKEGKPLHWRKRKYENERSRRSA